MSGTIVCPGLWVLASCSLFHQALPAPSFGWDSLGAMPVGVHSCASRDPLLSAGQSVCNEETTGEPFLAACPPPPMGGGRSSWQLGPAGWLQAEVMLVSWTDSLLQGRRAKQVLRQMKPRPALIYPKVLPTMRSVKRTTDPSV